MHPWKIQPTPIQPSPHHNSIWLQHIDMFKTRSKTLPPTTTSVPPSQLQPSLAAESHTPKTLRTNVLTSLSSAPVTAIFGNTTHSTIHENNCFYLALSRIRLLPVSLSPTWSPSNKLTSRTHSPSWNNCLLFTLHPVITETKIDTSKTILPLSIPSNHFFPH